MSKLFRIALTLLALLLLPVFDVASVLFLVSVLQILLLLDKHAGRLLSPEIFAKLENIVNCLAELISLSTFVILLARPCVWTVRLFVKHAEEIAARNFCSPVVILGIGIGILRWLHDSGINFKEYRLKQRNKEKELAESIQSMSNSSQVKRLPTFSPLSSNAGCVVLGASSREIMAQTSVGSPSRRSQRERKYKHKSLNVGELMEEIFMGNHRDSAN